MKKGPDHKIGALKQSWRLAFFLLDSAERAIQVAVIARAQSLNASGVSSVERSLCIGTTGGGCSRWRTKPQSNVVGMNRSSLRIRVHIGERRVGEHHRRGTSSGCHNERFDAEATDEVGDSVSMLVGRQVALILGQSERCVR